LTSQHYRLLVTDVDGTLIGRDPNISKENIEALDMVRRAGIQVSLSSGRSIKSCLPYIEQLSLESYHVFFDGALVSIPDLSEKIYVENIDRSMVREMIEFASSHEIDLELSSLSKYFSERETWSTDIKRRFFGTDTTVGDLTGLWEREEIIRADIVITNSEEEAKAALFMNHFTGRLQFTQAHTPRFPDATFINITSKGLSKGKALKALAKHMGIKLEEVAAVGDWINDIPLLSTAGLGIAMGNAHDDVKAVADHVTLDVEENGLAEAIKKHLL